MNEPIILGPTDTARLELQIDFAQSAYAWLDRGLRAMQGGDYDHAEVCFRVSRIAVDAARRARPCAS